MITIKINKFIIFNELLNFRIIIILLILLNIYIWRIEGLLICIKRKNLWHLPIQYHIICWKKEEDKSNNVYNLFLVIKVIYCSFLIFVSLLIIFTNLI